MIYNRYNISYKLYIIVALSLSFIFVNYNNNVQDNPTDVPELIYYKNQILKLLIPSKNCDLTLFFSKDKEAILIYNY